MIGPLVVAGTCGVTPTFVVDVGAGFDRDDPPRAPHAMWAAITGAYRELLP